MNFLDLTVYLDENNTLQYRGYTKPTDAKRYLNPKSFHPRSVFDSVPFSQLLRTIRNNSKNETKTLEIEQCVQQFKNSGYNPEDLKIIKEKAIAKASSVRDVAEEEDTLVFPLHFFKQMKEFKSVIYGLKQEIKQLIGETRIVFAVKKHGSNWKHDDQEHGDHMA